MASTAVPPGALGFDARLIAPPLAAAAPSAIPEPLCGSVVLLRDLILADQLPHFRATPEVKALLKGSQAYTQPQTSFDAFQVLLQASLQSGSVLPGLPEPEPAPVDPPATRLQPNAAYHDQPRTGSAAFPQQASVPQRKSIRLRPRLPPECEDTWPDTSHDAIRMQSDTRLADPRPVLGREDANEHVMATTRASAGFDGAAGTPVSVSSFDGNDYYSSQANSPDPSDAASVEPYDVAASVVQPTSSAIPAGLPFDQKTLEAALKRLAQQQGLPMVDVAQLAAGLMQTPAQTVSGPVAVADEQAESDYAPPSGDSDDDLHADYDPENISIDKYARQSPFQTLPPPSSRYEKANGHAPLSHQPHNTGRTTTRKLSESSFTYRGRPSRSDIVDVEPPRKRQRPDRRRERGNDHAHGVSQRTVRDSTEPRPTSDHRSRPSSTAGLAQSRRGFVPPPPDLAAIQAYAAQQAQLQPYQTPQPQLQQGPLQAPPVIASAVTPLASYPYAAQYPAPAAVVYQQPSTPMAQSPFAPPLFQQVAPVAPNPALQGYTLVRDQYGNAWYARPIQQPAPYPPPVADYSTYLGYQR